MPEGGRLKVKRNAHIVRLNFVNIFKKYIQKPVNSVGKNTAFIGKKSYAVKRTVDYAVSVNNQVILYIIFKKKSTFLKNNTYNLLKSEKNYVIVGFKWVDKEI